MFCNSKFISFYMCKRLLTIKFDFVTFALIWKKKATVYHFFSKLLATAAFKPTQLKI